MNPTENQLWKKIEAFTLDDDNASFQFSKRLARENGWSLKFAKNVIEEYKKFIFLCCISEKGATPSDQVDQAWHLHLTYTKSYWIDLCRDTLNKEIHHNPTKGGKSEGEKFDDLYTDTLKLYEAKFGIEAPQDIWPNNVERFSDIDFQRVNLKKVWILRKPRIQKSLMAILIFLSIGLLSFQSNSQARPFVIFVLVLCIGGILYSYFGGSNNDNNGSSPNGCGGHGSDGHSGCNGDSGCGSHGCSGCGSGCGGD